MKNKAVFLDRDGTLIKDAEYLDDLKKVSFYKRTAGAVKLLNTSGYKVIVVSNQSGVARGYFTEAFVKKTHVYLAKELKKKGAEIDAFYFCPHHEKGMGKYRKKCVCRKPSPGMVVKAVRKFNIDLKKSFIAGDKENDVKTGKNAGLKTIFVLTGKGRKEQKKLKKRSNAPDYTVRDIYGAALIAAKYDEKKKRGAYEKIRKNN